MQVTATAAPIVIATPPNSATKPTKKPTDAEGSTVDGAARRGAKRHAGAAGLDGDDARRRAHSNPCPNDAVSMGVTSDMDDLEQAGSAVDGNDDSDDDWVAAADDDAPPSGQQQCIKHPAASASVGKEETGELCLIAPSMSHFP